MLTITRSNIRKIKEGGEIIIEVVVITAQGIVKDIFNHNLIFRKVTNFDNGIQLNEKIKEFTTTAHNAVSVEKTPFTINRNIITNGVNTLTVIVKAMDHDFVINEKVYKVSRDDKLYQDIKEIL